MSKKVLIVEDEPLISDDLEIIVNNLGYDVVAMVDNAAEAISVLKSDKVDLVLLDVQLKGDEDGITVGKFIQDTIKIPFIYVTSFYDDDTIYRARETNPASYIVKPFKDGDIKANICLAFNKAPLSSNSDNGANAEQSFFVRKGGEIKKVDINSIHWIKGEDNYSDVFYENGEKYTATQTLKSIAEKFTDYGFVRVHKSYVVNLSKVTSISGQTLYVGMQSIPIGKAFRKAFFEKLTIF